VSTTSTVAVLTGSTLLAAGIAASADDPARELATRALATARLTTGWDDAVLAGQLFPTSLAAVRAYRSTPPGVQES
jgi:hypothetical protein